MTMPSFMKAGTVKRHSTGLSEKKNVFDFCNAEETDNQPPPKSAELSCRYTHLLLEINTLAPLRDVEALFLKQTNPQSQRHSTAFFIV